MKNRISLCLLSLLCASFVSIAQVPQSFATLSGTVVDPAGGPIALANVTLFGENGLPPQNAQSDASGQFSFSKVAPGPFHLSISASGFTTRESVGTISPGETATLPRLALEVATVRTNVQVSASQVEVAEMQIKEEEKQRLLGILPNYEVSYPHFAVPLVPRQKFELVWKTSFDPVTLLVIGAVAGVEQKQRDFKDYGQGAAGYGKRFGAAYADFFIADTLSRAVFPTFLKQDPRYFVRGKGSKISRFNYAVANAFICKSDSGHWQPKYSSFLGGLSSIGIANLYYPKANRFDPGLAFETFGFGIGSRALANVFQEFLSKKLTPKAHN